MGKAIAVLCATAGVVLTATVAGASASEQRSEKETLFAFFATLAGGEWHGTGRWASGGSFVQVHRYERAPDGIIVRAQTLIPDSASGRLIVRAEGVRAWDQAAGLMRFWEFDRAGGITSGRVGVQDDVVYYEYQYAIGGQERTLRDTWRANADGAYDYRVGIWQDGSWKQIFLDAQFRRRPRGSSTPRQ
jgi:hypothetical protein